MKKLHYSWVKLLNAVLFLRNIKPALGQHKTKNSKYIFAHFSEKTKQFHNIFGLNFCYFCEILLNFFQHWVRFCLTQWHLD